jgi:phenylalanyl-tRNA synthetase beta chain
MGWEVGCPSYETGMSNLVLRADSTVRDVRPYVLAAVVEGLKLTDEDIRELMDMQEDIHWGLGRNRRKASIGMHDLRAVKPLLAYTTGRQDEVRFVPLDEQGEMSLQEVLDRLDKGREFRHLLEGATRYPIITDEEGVISFPPIINSARTQVTRETTDLFIEVTGTNMPAVSKALNVLVTTLAEMGGVIRKVRVEYPDRKLVSPDLKVQRRRLRTRYVRQLSGIKFSDDGVISCLNRSRLDAEKVRDGVLEVSIPAYRTDILHEVDLVEEVLIGYGYYRIEPTSPPTITSGVPHEMSELENRVRELMLGLGFVEVVNFLLTNEEAHYRWLRLKSGKPVRLANPVSAEYSILRESLLPSLMKNLADNKHESYPQKLFEVSDVVKVKRGAEVLSERILCLGGVISHPKADFTEARSCAEAVLTNLGVSGWKVKDVQHPSFIRGRTAALYLGGKRLGVVGEVHPEVLNNFGLENPVSAFEIDLQLLARHRLAG